MKHCGTMMRKYRLFHGLLSSLPQQIWPCLDDPFEDTFLVGTPAVMILQLSAECSPFSCTLWL